MNEHQHLQPIKVTEDMKQEQANTLGILSFGFEMQKFLKEKEKDWEKWHYDFTNQYTDALKMWFSNACFKKDYIKIAVLAMILHHRKQIQNDQR